MIYENGILSRILVDGGFITMIGTTPTHHYNIQDHQGNSRVVFNQSGTIEQTNHYYLFGMTFGEGTDNSDQRYKYNGKELDRMHGLDLYDYGARHYDAAIGRWGVIDPLAEKYYSISPYVYCVNNPIRFIDLDGQEVRITTHYDKEKDKIVYNFSVTGVVYNNSDNKTLNMNALLTGITKQFKDVYTISRGGLVTTMSCNLRVASSVDDIKSTDDVFQVVNQADLRPENSNTSENLRVLGNNTLGTLNINILDEVANRIITGKDRRTIAHEFGHSAGLPHMGLLEDMNNLMIQSWRIQDAGKDPSKATFLNNGQINLMMHNYINGKINKVSPVRSFLFKKILTK